MRDMDENEVDKPTIPEVLPLVRAFYAKEGNSVGGKLHIVLDDGNYEATHVQWCLDEARKAGDADAVALAEVLLRMSDTQRKKLSRMYQDYAP